jgi:hypothetical protein
MIWSFFWRFQNCWHKSCPSIAAGVTEQLCTYIAAPTTYLQCELFLETINLPANQLLNKLVQSLYFLFVFFSAPTMQIKQIKPNSSATQKPYALARFEPGSPVPEAEAMSTAQSADVMAVCSRTFKTFLTLINFFFLGGGQTSLANSKPCLRVRWAATPRQPLKLSLCTFN